MLESAHPEVVRVFLAELAHVLEYRVEPADFLVVLRRSAAHHTEGGLDPYGARFHGIDQVDILRNRFLFALERLECHDPLFPEGDASIQIERALRELHLERIAGRFQGGFGMFRDRAFIHHPDGIEQVEACGRIFLPAGHPRIGDLLGERFRSRTHLAQALDSRECGILVRARHRKHLHVVTLRLLLLLDLFQVHRVAEPEGSHLLALGVTVQVMLQGIRAGRFRKRRIAKGRIDAEVGRRLCKQIIFFKFRPLLEDFAHARKVALHKAGFRHAEHYRRFELGIAGAERLVGHEGAVPLFGIVVVGGLRKVADIRRKRRVGEGGLRKVRMHDEVLKLVRFHLFELGVGIHRDCRGSGSHGNRIRHGILSGLVPILARSVTCDNQPEHWNKTAEESRPTQIHHAPPKNQSLSLFSLFATGPTKLEISRSVMVCAYFLYI